MKKMILTLVMLMACAGCGTPAPVREAVRVEAEALRAFKADHDAIVEALFSDLHLALETQIRLIENYELKAKGPTVTQADLAALMEQARKKREEVAEKLKALRAKVKTADRNFEIAMQIHDTVASFLKGGDYSGPAVDGLLENVTGLLGSQLKGRN